MKTIGNKKGHLDLSEIPCNMCKTEDDEVSDDLSDSGEEGDEPTETKSKEFNPLERRKIREMREFQGTHPRGGGSLKSGYKEGDDIDMNLDPPTFRDEEELDDNKTMATTTNDEDKSFATAQSSCFTRRLSSTKHVAFADIDDFTAYKSHRTLKPPEPPNEEECQDNTDVSSDSDDLSDQSSTKTGIPEQKNQEIKTEPKNTKKLPGKYKSMKDTLKRVSAEVENRLPKTSSIGSYQPQDKTNPSHAPTQSDGEGKGKCLIH